MKEQNRRELLIAAIATAGSLALNSCGTKPNPELDPQWQKMLAEQGKRVEEDLDRVGLYGDLPLIDFSKLSYIEQEKLTVAPGANGYFSFHPQSENYVLTRFLVNANNQPVVVGISVEKQQIEPVEKAFPTHPTANLRFDLSKFLRFIEVRELFYRKSPNVREYKGIGGFSVIAYDDPQKYVSEPDALLGVTFRGDSRFVETVKKFAQRRK